MAPAPDVIVVTGTKADLLKLVRNRGDSMKATRILHDLGQSIWLDNITRDC